MKMLERIYRSPFGRVMSFVVRNLSRLHEPFMVYGYYDCPSRSFRKYTRMSSTTKILNRTSLSVGDHVWVNHFSILDASQGLAIGEGAQIGPWVGIFSHGSENSIRLLGKEYVHIPYNQRKGYTRGAVEIAEYSLIGARSLILPGVKVGKGCLISAGTIVTKDVPDYAIVLGSPGKIIGTTKDRDKMFFEEADFADTYYDPQVFADVMKSLSASTDKKLGQSAAADKTFSRTQRKIDLDQGIHCILE